MRLQKISDELSDQVDGLNFGPPVTWVYNPLSYARALHHAYLELAQPNTDALLLGMNPGPWGMAQTGVPFGEVAAARDWLGINAPIGKPTSEHPKRPVDGLACTRSEVSGRRLWGLFSERFATPEKFFTNHFIINHCPLAFMEDTGRNRTPDKLPAAESGPLMDACDSHLRRVVQILEPEWLIAVGGFAEKRATEALSKMDVRVGKILHPSPASPAANRGWAEQATAQMTAQGVW